MVGATAERVLAPFEVLDEQGTPLPVTALPGRSAIRERRIIEKVLRFRYRHSRVDRWSIITSTPVLDEQGEATMVINVFRDVTRARREAAANEFLAEAGRV